MSFPTRFRLALAATALILTACASAARGGSSPDGDGTSAIDWRAPTAAELGLPSASALLAVARPLALGEPASGELTGAATVLRDGSRYESWRFTGRRGDRVLVTLRGQGFQPFLIIGGVHRDTIEIIDARSPGETTEAAVGLELHEDGPFVVLANTLEPGARGRYTLSLEPLQPRRLSLAREAILQTRPIPRGRTETGTLGDANPRLEDDSPYQLWRHTAEARDTLLVTLSSREFEPYLYFGELQGGDSLRIRTTARADGGNAVTRVVLPEPGSYVIAANAYEPSGRGRYTLRVETAQPWTVRIDSSVAGRGRALGTGVPERGSLSGEDPVLNDQTHYAVWRFEGHAGDRVMLTMRAPDFDAYLYAGQARGDRFHVLQSDDDSGGGTDARIWLELPADGSYTVLANGVEPSDLGAYTIILEPARSARVVR